MKGPRGRRRAGVLHSLCVSFQYNYNSGISYETLGPDEVRSLLTTVSSRAGLLSPSGGSLHLLFVSAAMRRHLRTHQEDVHQVSLGWRRQRRCGSFSPSAITPDPLMVTGFMRVHEGGRWSLLGPALVHRWLPSVSRAHWPD